MSLLAIKVAESPVKSEGLQDELRAFDATKTGVKGLVDAGIENIPKIFIRPADEVAEESNYGHSNLQMVSNDVFKSAWHRVLSNQVGPRISVACFLAGVMDPAKVYGPIKELTTEENPPIYKDFTVNEHLAKFYSKPIGKSCLDDFKLKN
ncbi:unnamed protein product [Fraxinus pennsylvanica]|uniref:Uncharacterized protein n=1 Tax=Fraxinus pennsylvanica TaxID=56036 RepID=A0AAD2A7R3_9LAMI|nr:unnamed protein product [Fraxinus pennsylvanica]